MTNDESSAATLTTSGCVASYRSPESECRRQRARERRLQRLSSRKLVEESFSSISSRTLNSSLILSESYTKLGITPCDVSESMHSPDSASRRSYLEQLPANRRLYYLASEEHRKMLLESLLHGDSHTSTTTPEKEGFRGDPTTSNE